MSGSMLVCVSIYLYGLPKQDTSKVSKASSADKDEKQKLTAVWSGISETLITVYSRWRLTANRRGLGVLEMDGEGVLFVILFVVIIKCPDLPKLSSQYTRRMKKLVQILTTDDDECHCETLQYKRWTSGYATPLSRGPRSLCVFIRWYFIFLLCAWCVGSQSTHTILKHHDYDNGHNVNLDFMWRIPQTAGMTSDCITCRGVRTGNKWEKIHPVSFVYFVEAS